jgi:hypothetical protein
MIKTNKKILLTKFSPDANPNNLNNNDQSKTSKPSQGNSSIIIKPTNQNNSPRVATLKQTTQENAKNNNSTFAKKLPFDC